MPRRIGSRSGGFLLMDAVIGIVILGILAGVMVDTMRRSNQAQKRLADTRAAARLAESRLVELQSGAPLLAAVPDDQTTSVTALPDPSPAGAMRWVRVRATVGGREAELVGLVPQSAATQPAGGVAP